MTFGLLGPIEVRVDGRLVPLGGRHGQAVLGALLLDPNRVVPLARLIDAAWGETPPSSVRVQAQNRVSSLRRLLREAGAAEGIISTRGSGYLARIEPGQLDVEAFEEQVLLADGCIADEAATRLAQALSLWRGAALDGLRTPLLAAAAQRLDERRLNVLGKRLELDLRLGRYHMVIGELVELTAAYPAQEQLAGQLMRALYLADRQREALEHFVAEAAAQLRSLLAGRRALLLLDNAGSEDQVRPLLPGSPGCLVVVTSRSELPGLVAAEGACPLPLDLLTVDEARHLLQRRLGRHRVAAAPRAVDEIISRCARLPLALTVVAARAATHPEFSLDTLASELGDEVDSLDSFAGEDTATDIRAVFSWSYRTLDDPTARLFRLLGLHSGPDVDTTAAASLAGLPVRRVRPLLAALARAHLLAEHSPGRYTIHDLLRAYAGELARAHGTDDERDAALHRLLDHYVHTAHAAARLLSPHQAPISLAPPKPGVTVEAIDDHGQALAWFNAERITLLAFVDQAAAAGYDAHAWQLAWSIETFSDYRGYWHDQAAAWRTALAAARRLGDRDRQAHAHRCVALVFTRLRRYRDAHRHLKQAFDLYRELGDQTGEAHVHRAFNWVYERQDRHDEALRHARQAVDLFRLIGDRYGQARALNSAGWNHTHLGEYREALDCCQQALAIHREIDDRYGEAAAWDSLGYTRHRLGDHRRAIDCYRHAFDLIRELGSRYNEAVVLNHLGETYCAAGDVGSARQAWQQALEILDGLEHPDAAQIRGRFEGLDQRATATAAPVAG